MLGKSSSRVKPIALGATVQSSTYGQTIPVLYGRTKAALYLIWEQNIRQGGGGKKYKKSLGKKSPPDFEANVDFLLGHNPMAGVLQAWQNQNLRFPLSFSVVTGLDITGPTLTITDPNFYFVLGVTISYQIDRFSGGGDVTLPPDYGAPNVSTTYGAATYFEYPAWNECYQGPDPGAPNALRFLPKYRWIPGSGNVIHIDGFGAGWALPFSTANVYYALLDPNDSKDFTKNYSSDVPLTALRLTFENVLGSGPEYSGYSSQQILYPHYAGVGSPNFDMGSTQTMPDTRLEVVGSFPTYPTADVDFVDMIQDIFKQGISQAGFGAASATSPLQRGLNCYDYPNLVQLKQQGNTEPGAPPITYPLANTPGNYLIAAVVNGGGGSVTISDTDANTWIPVVSVPGFGLWYAVAVGGPAFNTITFGGVGIISEEVIMEVAGVNTLDSVVTVAGPNTVSVTTTNQQGSAGFLLAIAQFNADANTFDPGLSQWQAPFVGFNLGFKRTVYSPGTYTIPVTESTISGPVQHLTLFAFKSSQPALYPRPLGDILDTASMECTRAQCRANGLIGSLLMDTQKKASDWLKDLYDAANAAPVWSGFTLKTIPYSEVSLFGPPSKPMGWYLAPSSYGGKFYGVVIPPGNPVTVPPLALTESDFVGTADQPLITVERKAQVDVPNILQVQFPNRTSDYNPIIVSQPEDGSRALYGPRKDSPRMFSCVQDPSVARTLLGIMVRKQAYLRNTYKFKLNAKWKLLEPMDLILLPASATMPTIAGVPATLNTIPVRLTSISESETYELDCEAEPYIWGTYAPYPLSVTAPQPYLPAIGATPANINPPIIFEPVPRLSGEPNQNELWLVVSDHDPTYGGCMVYISVDGGNSYSNLGTILGNAITGVTTADWPTTADPDTTANLLVNLTESNGALTSYTTSDEDNFVHPCYVGNAAGGGVVQTANNSAGASTSVAKAFTTNNILNNAIVVIGWNQTGGSLGTLSVTDSNGNSYSSIGITPVISSSQVHAFVAFGIAAGANTVTLHSTHADNLGMMIFEVSGIASVDAFSGASTLGASVSSVNTGNITVGNANDFEMSFALDAFNTGDTFFSNSGWTQEGAPFSGVGSFQSYVWGAGGQTTNTLGPTAPISTSGFHVGIIAFTANTPLKIVAYELMTYAVATLGSPFMYTLSATSGNHLRRSVFGAPFVNTGPDHPTGSRFAFLQAPGITAAPGIFKQRMDPLWIGKVLHFKFLAFNQSLGGLQSLSDVNDYLYVPQGTVGTVNPFSQDYTEVPANPLTNPTSTTIHMVQVEFTFSGNANPVIYNARTFTITAPTVPTLYYVTIADPGFLGDNGTLSTLPATCQTSNALVGIAGNTYIGSIVALPAGGGTGNPGGLVGGQPPPAIGHYIPDPIIANAITPDLALGLYHEVTLINSTVITINNPTYAGGAVPAGIEFVIVIVQDGTGGWPTPTWGSNYTGVTGFEIGGDANSRNTFRFIATAAGKFARSVPPDTNIT